MDVVHRLGGMDVSAGLEWILAFRPRGTALVIDPCIPKSWPRFEIAFQYHSARYEIVVENPNGVSHGVSRVVLDGESLQTTQSQITLSDDAATHHVRVILK